MAIFNAGTDDCLKNKFLSAGIHPAEIEKPDLELRLKNLRSLSEKQNVLAIGECGLDRFVNTTLQIQERIFRQQIAIAEEIKKPLIIHCVRSFNELIRIKKESGSTLPFIIHGFNNNIQIAEQLLKHNCYLSFGKALLTEGSNAQKALRLCKDTQYFLETDNAPVSINIIFEKAAELKNISSEVLKEKMMLNLKTVFNYG